MTTQTSAIMRAETEIELGNQALREGIRRRAYELYELRGRENGHDLEDWLRAESELVRPVLRDEELSSEELKWVDAETASWRKSLFKS